MDSRENYLTQLSQMVNADPDLLSRLRASTDKQAAISLLAEAASKASISFDKTRFEAWLSSLPSLDKATLDESELEAVAAGGTLPDGVRAFLAAAYGTGVVAAIFSTIAEASKPGGAKLLADAIFKGTDINMGKD